MSNWAKELSAVLERLARAAKRDGIALYLAARDRRVSWMVKACAVVVAAYVLSPIDLIPDFIPVLGLLDEMILVPLAVGILVRFVDPDLMQELREEAARIADKPRSRLGAAMVMTVWAFVAMAVAWAFWPGAPEAHT